MAEEKPKWMDYLAITTVLVAVCATLSTFKGGGYGSKSLLNQANASDQWAYYQSKSIKGYIYDMNRDNIELQYKTQKLKSTDAALEKEYTDRIASYTEKVSKYNQEKEEIKAKAEAFEAARDGARLHSERFGLAVIFLQVSILLSSIAALAKQKQVWLLGVAVGVIGVAYFLNGFFILW